MWELKFAPRFSRIATNGIELHVAEAGPAGGPLVFLLHGFPEFWYGWRNQIAPLAEKGFHVIAPDQRGYNLSDKPRGVSSYDLDQLAADIAGLADFFGQERFAVAGHDWGGSVGWWLAARYPRRLRRLVALAAPHPAVWQDAMRGNPAQKRKSAYVRFFQIAYLPELLIGAGRCRALARGFRDSIRPDAFTERDLEQYRTAWSQPGTLTSMLHYYRAVWSKPFRPAAEYRVELPVLVIWGEREAYAIPELADTSAKLCADARVVNVAGATHWVQHDQPARVAEMIADCFQE